MVFFGGDTEPLPESIEVDIEMLVESDNAFERVFFAHLIQNVLNNGNC